MGHITPKSYYDLQNRLNKAPQGAPASESLFKILEILFTEKEAKLVSTLPINFFTTKKAAQLWNLSIPESEKILNELSSKGLLLDIKMGKTKAYILAPSMAGFFEFSLMRTDGKFDRKILSELFYQYINVEDDFLREVLGLDPSIVRTFVQENTINTKEETIILDYERATKVIDTASCITVGTCYCRHKMEHLGKACNMPQDVCLTFNNTATSLAKHKIAKEITKKEAHEILNKSINLGLVQIGDNVQDGVNFICNCCACCCEALLAYKKLKYSVNMKSNFESIVNNKKCTRCGICIKKCPVNAISFKKIKNDKNTRELQINNNKKNISLFINPNICIGCGVCVRFCKSSALTMNRRENTQFTPKDSFERVVITAINTGKLQNLIFDNRDLWTHKMLRQLLKTILSLKPAKRILATNQLQSKFINNMSKAYGNTFTKLFNDDKLPDYSHPELKANKQLKQ
ncbi:MAG: 4Fe-4S binding protein [Candidatus Woesearchaeota archaeon]|jgi:ferredoxin